MEQPSTANVKDTSTPAHDLVRVKTEPVNIETDPAFAEIKKLKTELMNCRNTILKSKLEAEQSRAKLSDNEMLIAEMHSAYELYRTEKETALAELKNSVGEKNKLIEELESNINYWKNQTSAIVAKHTDLQTEVAAATALLTERARELERILQNQAAEKQLWDQERKQFTLMVDLLEQIEQAHRQKKGISREPITPSVSTEYTMHDREKANKNENERAFPPSPSTTPGEALSQRSNGSPAPFSAGIDRVEIATTEQPRSGSEGSFTKDKMVESNSIQSQRSPADQVFEGSGQIFVNDVYGMRRPIGTRLIKVYRSTQRTSGECVFIDNSPNEAQVPIVLPIGSALGVLFDGSELDIRGTENGTTVIYHLVLGSPQEAVELYTTIQNVGNEKALASPGNGASQQQVESRLQMAQVKPPSPTHPSRTSVSYIHLYNPQGTYTLQDQAPIMSGQPSQEQQYHMQRVPLQVLTQPTWHAYPPSSEGPSMGPVHSVPYHHPYNEYHPLLASGMTHGLHQQQLQTISRQHLVPMVHNPSHVNQPEQYQTASYTANSRR